MSLALLKLIIQHLDPLERDELQLLARFCLASKQSLALARPHLYSSAAILDRRCVDIRNADGGDRRRDCDSLLDALRPCGPAIHPPYWHLERMEDQEMTAHVLLVGDALRRELPEEDYDSDDIYRVWSWRDLMDRRSIGLLTSLRAHPHLRSLVKHLQFVGVYEGRAAYHAVHQFLVLCPGIRALDLLYHRPPREPGITGFSRNEQPELQLLADIVRMPSLERLHVRFCHHRNVQLLLKTVSSLKQLKHFSFSFEEQSRYGWSLSDNLDHCIEEAVGHPRVEVDLPALPSTLTSFGLGTVAEPETFDSLTAPFLDTITSLSIAVRREAFDLTGFVHLEHLAVAFARYSTVADTLEDAPPSLRSLELRWSRSIEFDDANDRGGFGWGEYGSDDDDSDDSDDSNDSLSPFAAPDAQDGEKKRKKSAKAPPKKNSLGGLLPALPHSITYLHLAFYLEEAKERDALLAAVKAKTKRGKNGTYAVLPRLALLDVADESVADLDRWDDRGDPTKIWRRAETHRRHLMKECAKRGLALGSKRESWDDRQERADLDRLRGSQAGRSGRYLMRGLALF
ncbi:hypothetical protein JCM10207_002094 [Rhodosporidiobolus poonsookiae]